MRAALAVVTAVVYIALLAQVVSAEGPKFIPDDGRTVPIFLVDHTQAPSGVISDVERSEVWANG
jgi:hypothetical protein